MPIPANQITVAQLVLRGTLAGEGPTSKIITQTFYYRRSALTNPPSKTTLAAQFLAGPYAAFLAAANVNWSSGVANIRWLNDATDPFVPFTLAGVGAIATQRLPAYASVYFRKNSSLRGKQYQSSFRVAAANEADTAGDVLTGAGLVRWQAVQAAYLAPLVTADNTWNPTNVSFKQSQVKINPTTVVANDIVTIVLDLTVGTMRKRKAKTLV